MYRVYCLQTSDGRRYVGVTSTPLSVRWNNGNGYRFSKDLWDSIVADGWEHIVKTVLGENLTLEQASAMERHYIELWDTQNPQFGYNRELGGIGKVKVVSEVSREKMRAAKLGKKNPNYGIRFSEERRQKIAESNRGQKRSIETREKIALTKEIAVVQLSKTGKRIAVWESGKKAALATGAQAGHIAKVCKHKRATAGGFVWAYAD